MSTREQNRQYQNNWYATENGKQKRYEANKRWRLKKQTEYKKIKSTLKCNRCGENHIACLEFHHLDPSQKEGNVGSKFRNVSTKKLLEEIAKCEVLCANCHRKEHHK